MLGEVAETPGTILSEEEASRRNDRMAFEGPNGPLFKGLKGGPDVVEGELRMITGI